MGAISLDGGGEGAQGLALSTKEYRYRLRRVKETRRNLLVTKRSFWLTHEACNLVKALRMGVHGSSNSGKGRIGIGIYKHTMGYGLMIPTC